VNTNRPDSFPQLNAPAAAKSDEATVFVTSEDPRFDYTAALEFGSSVVGVFPPGQVHLQPQVALNRARSVLASMRPTDYLALSGDPVKIGICVAVAVERVGRVKMLRWNRHTLSYIDIEVDFLDNRNTTLVAT